MPNLTKRFYCTRVLRYLILGTIWQVPLHPLHKNRTSTDLKAQDRNIYTHSLDQYQRILRLDPCGRSAQSWRRVERPGLNAPSLNQQKKSMKSNHNWISRNKFIDGTETDLGEHQLQWGDGFVDMKLKCRGVDLEQYESLSLAVEHYN